MNQPNPDARKEWTDVFVVAGPTASGKSQLAVELAEKWDAEIISADAYQVYRGLSLLTAQPSADQRDRVRHHLVDVLEPAMEFSPVDFARLARTVVEEIRERGKRIVIAGGAGFYLEALLDGLPETPPPNAGIRLRLSQLSLEELVAELEANDPSAAGIVDLQNPRRVQRALEVVLMTGRPFASFARKPNTTTRGFVLDLPRDILHQRIEQRVIGMLENGAIDEVKRLGPCSATCQKAIGLREIADFIEGKISLAKCREKITIATRQYGKRQLTWFRNRARWDFVPPETALEYAMPF